MTDQAGGGQDEHNEDRYQDENRGSGTSRPAGGTGSSGSKGRQAPRSRQGGQSPDMLTEFQRWLIRSSAKNMRKQMGSQVRRTLGGRTDSSDVWDTATTEIPPEVGESPECQWCPVCRAARRMRESNTDFGGHLSTAGDVVSSAGDVVASAVQEAMRAFDSVLARAGRGETRSSGGNGWAADNGEWSSARDSWAAAHGGQPGDFPEGAEEDLPEAPADDRSDEPEGSDEPHDRG